MMHFWQSIKVSFSFLFNTNNKLLFLNQTTQKLINKKTKPQNIGEQFLLDSCFANEFAEVKFGKNSWYFHVCIFGGLFDS